MNRIWANSLEDGAKAWEDVPMKHQSAVKDILREDVYLGRLTSDRYEEITGEQY